MKTSELIEELRRLDPSGEMECLSTSEYTSQMRDPSLTIGTAFKSGEQIFDSGHGARTRGKSSLIEPINVIVL